MLAMLTGCIKKSYGTDIRKTALEIKSQKNKQSWQMPVEGIPQSYKCFQLRLLKKTCFRALKTPSIWLNGGLVYAEFHIY